MLDAARRAVALARRGSDAMSIFVDENTKVIVQGLTGARGASTGCATATTAPRSSPA